MICGSGGSKNRLAKAAGAEPCGEMRNEKLHAAAARSTFPTQIVSQMAGLGPLLELRGPVAQSAFPSQNVEKHQRFGALLEVRMSKSVRKMG